MRRGFILNCSLIWIYIVGLAINNFLCKTNYRWNQICSEYLFNNIWIRHLHSGLMCQIKFKKEMGEFGSIHCILYWERWILYMAVFRCSSKEIHHLFKKKKRLWPPLPIYHIPSASLLDGPCVFAQWTPSPQCWWLSICRRAVVYVSSWGLELPDTRVEVYVCI